MENPLIVTGKPLEKLITLIGQAIGVLYEPRKIRNKADADAYRLVTIAEAKAKGLIITSEAELTVAERAKNRLTVQAIDRQLNIENIIDKTAGHFKENCNSQEVGKDWSTRFFNRAQDISDGDLQEIWANILATEISQPGTVSLRTLDILSNITQAEGNIFQTFCSLCFDHVGLYHPISGPIYGGFGLTYTEIQKLRSARLVHANDNLKSTLLYNPDLKGWAIVRSDEVYVLSNGAIKDISFDVIALTSEGIEVMNIIKVPKNEEYFLAFLKDCMAKRKIEHRKINEDEKIFV